MNFEQARYNMIEQQVRPAEVLDHRVLETMQRVRREDFVPTRYRKLAFADIAIDLKHGQQMMKPILEGQLLQAADVQPGESVLEIGTGSGYLTACLAALGARLTSVDIHQDFIDSARSRVDQAGFHQVDYQQADVMSDWSPGCQYDLIVVTGSLPELPTRFLDWLKPEGRIFIVTGSSPAMTACMVRRDDQGEVQSQCLFETDLGPLLNAETPARFTF